MNSGLEKNQNFETGDFNPSLQNTVTEVKKLKKKLEQMLQDQNLPAGSAGVEIDDLTAAHSETNVRLGRLDELEKKEQSVKETEKKMGEALEAITKHEEELSSVKQSMGEDAKLLKEQDKIIKEAEYQKNYDEEEYNKLLEDKKELEENYEKFQESSIDDSFVDEEDAHYPKERVEQAEEDSNALADGFNDEMIQRINEAEAQDAATEAEEAAYAQGATLEEQHNAYDAAYDDFDSTFSASPLESYGIKERIDAAQELKDKAKYDISITQANLSKLGDQHEEISSNLNQAQKDYESARIIAANMKSERDQLKNDIITNLEPLVEKINKLYGNFISAKKSNKVVEKSNKVKNELEELKKELSDTEDQVDEHKELVQHGIIKNTVIHTTEIDQILHNLTIKHDKILETLDEKDDRNTSGLNLEEHVTVSHHTLPEEHERVRSFFIQYFNIPETKLVTDLEKQRLDLEVDLAIFRLKKKLLNKILENQERHVTTQEYKIGSFGRGSLESLTIPKPPPDRLQHMTSADTPTFDEIQPDTVLVQEFTWISILETQFRKLVAVILKYVNNWWTELVPDNVRYNARDHNNRNNDFLKWDKTQDFRILEFVNFTGLTKIFTGVKCWKYFSSVFPEPVGYNEDPWFNSLKARFTDTGYCRNRVGHNNRLDEMSHDKLHQNFRFFIKCITDFKKK